MPSPPSFTQMRLLCMTTIVTSCIFLAAPPNSSSWLRLQTSDEVPSRRWNGGAHGNDARALVQPPLGSDVMTPTQHNASFPATPPAIKAFNTSSFPRPSHVSEATPLAAHYTETGPWTTPGPAQADAAIHGGGPRAMGHGALAQVASQNTSTGKTSVAPPTNIERALARAKKDHTGAERPAAGAAGGWLPQTGQTSSGSHKAAGARCEPHHNEEEAFFEVCSSNSVFAAHLRVKGIIY